MFDNLLFQNVSNQLITDLKNNKLPSSILLSGPEASGKLTCALELGRVLSCTGNGTLEKGNWLCDCPACRKNKELTGTNIILAGPRDCSLEMLAARKTLIHAARNNSTWITAARYLFIRSVRKLTLRFSPVLWEGDDKISKISPLLEDINDNLEILSISKALPPIEELEKLTEKIIASAEKLENGYLYDSLPIDHIRRASFWAHLKSNDGKKVIIIENVEKMNESCRNALLKILEEPPEDVFFILTTARRGAVMQTILSRVRTYTFFQRTGEQQKTVISRVFHHEGNDENVIQYLQTYLPVTPEAIKKEAFDYYAGIKNNHLVNVAAFVKNCGDFEPRTLFKIFLRGLTEAQREVNNPEIEHKNLEAIIECYNNVAVFNVKPVAALEKLYRDLASIRKVNLR